MSLEAFPLNGAVVALTATNSAPTPSAFAPANGRIRVYNSGSQTAFVHSGIGASDGTATTSHAFIGAGDIETFTVPTNHTHISAILASAGTATVYVQVGEGM